MKYIRKNLVGQKFDRLTVIRFIDINITPSNKYGQYRYECLCDCGKTVILQDRTLLRKTSKSCGCYRKELFRKLPGESTITSLFCSYRCGAKKRDLTFNISIEQFKILIAGNCNYCGLLPVKYSLKTNCTKEWLEQSSILCNRIDRVNNDIGYEINNCVSCCKRCNEMKMAATSNDFINHVKTIYEFQLKNSKIGENNDKKDN